MANKATVTDTEKTGTEEQDAAAQAAAAAAGETATPGEAGAEGTEKEGEKTPEQIEEERLAAIEKGKAGTDKGVQKRIDKATKEAREAREEAAYQRGRAEALEQALGKGGKKDTGAGPGDDDAAALEAEYVRAHPEPQEAEFQKEGRSADEAWRLYVRALSDWNYDRRTFIDQRKGEKAGRQKTETEETARLQQNLQGQIEQGKKEFENYEDLMSTLELTATMMGAIAESKVNGHRISVYLAQNPKEADRIAELKPFLQAKEIGKIETKIESGAIQLKKPSKAPEPAPHHTGGGGSSVDAEEKRYTDPNTPTEERIRISQERKTRAAAGK